MRFVIGDIHGEITKLRCLISNLKEFDIEELIFIGDYINKGENSKETLIYLQELSKEYNSTFLIGNHEYAWMEFITNGEYRDFLENFGGLTTLKDFEIKEFEQITIKKRIFDRFKDFFRNLKKFVILKDFIITHSGINLKYVYYDNWDKLEPKEFVFQRWEFIKYDKLIRNRIFIFGHTGFYFPYYDKVKIGLDTGATYSTNATLTAFETENRFFIDNFNRMIKLDELSLCPALIRGYPYRQIKKYEKSS